MLGYGLDESSSNPGRGCLHFMIMLVSLRKALLGCLEVGKSVFS